MRKLAYISGTIFSSITVLSVLFKLLHYQGAQVLLILGTGGLALIFIPIFALYKYNNNK